MRNAWIGGAAIALVMSSSCAPPADPCEPGGDRICTWAGTGDPGFDGDGNPLLESRFYWPVDVSFTSTGTYIMDWNNHRVRHVEDDGTLQTVIGTDFIGDGPDDLSDLEAPGADGLTVHLNHPTQIHELPDGKLLLVAWHNHKLRTYDPETGKVLVMCGRGAGYAGDGSSDLDEARLNQPSAAVIDELGGIYILDQRNQRIRYIDPDGVIDTVAGSGEPGFADGPLLEAQFSFPTGSNPPPNGGIALDDQGRLYVADSLNHRIRRVDFEQGVVETFAGTGEPGFSGDGGAATEAQINNPRDLTMGPDGRLYFSDEKNHRVRAIDVDTGVIETIAGTGEPGYEGDEGSPKQAKLYEPSGLAFGPDGNLYISDTGNHVIRVMGAP